MDRLFYDQVYRVLLHSTSEDRIRAFLEWVEKEHPEGVAMVRFTIKQVLRPTGSA